MPNSNEQTLTAFVTGATGYTGRAVVDVCLARDYHVIAHVRPDSGRLDEHRSKFEGAGAEVDTTAWEEAAMAATLAELQPDLVFCCIGTTASRKSTAAEPDKETYEAVDYGLTALLVRACLSAEIRPKFVYLSSMGASGGSVSGYMRARYRAEEYVRHSELPHVIARAPIISGPDRPEPRPAERLGAVVSDVGLGVLGAVGFVGLRDRFSSLSGEELAFALVELAVDPTADGGVFDARELRKRSARS